MKKDRPRSASARRRRKENLDLSGLDLSFGLKDAPPRIAAKGKRPGASVAANTRDVEYELSCGCHWPKLRNESLEELEDTRGHRALLAVPVLAAVHETLMRTPHSLRVAMFLRDQSPEEWRLLGGGIYLDPDVVGSRMIAMDERACHQNVAALYRAHPGELRIMTGYALGPGDGIWRAHSWGRELSDGKEGAILETTSDLRDLYFGFTLSDEQAVIAADEWRNP